MNSAERDGSIAPGRAQLQVAATEPIEHLQVSVMPFSDCCTCDWLLPAEESSPAV